MPDKYTELAPAKINLFLKVLNKRDDNYYNIRTGVTFVNLFDEINVEESSSFKVSYQGKFSPQNNFFDDCIIEKLFKIFSIKKPNYNFIIKKNIPIQSGLGSASSNVAAVLRILEKLNLYKLSSDADLVLLGSDVPLFLYMKNCLVRGKGDKISSITVPKYFFLLVKPIINHKTKEMYSLINNLDLDYNISEDTDLINDSDCGNDFEKIVNSKDKGITEILTFLRGLEKVIFANLTGSGSCCYAVFQTKNSAINAKSELNKKFPQLWNHIVENNFK